MSKQPDFGNDLAALNDNVTAAVDDVLQVLQQKRTANRSIAGNTNQDAAAKHETNGASLVVEAVTAQPAAASSPRRQRSISRSRLTPTVEHDEPLENVTTRLRQKTNELLTEAALRQRLKKESPATRQDIVEAALGDWFRKHGYSRSQAEESADT
jgi:hypothetical protein